MKNNQEKFFEDNGYSKVTSFLSKKNKTQIFELFKSCTKKYIKFDKFKDFENLELHKKLIQLRKKDYKKFGDFYDFLNLNSSLRSIFYQEKFIKKFAKLLKTNRDNIFINGFMFRMDAPNDNRNILNWHQDSLYYQMTYPEQNAGVCWIAITKNSNKNGTLIFIPRSHKKLIETKSNKKNSHSSEQFKIKISSKEKKIAKNFNSDFGDSGFFHLNIKHKSGKNISKKIRMVIGCRFHDMKKKFNIGKEIYYFNKTKKPLFFNKK